MTIDNLLDDIFRATGKLRIENTADLALLRYYQTSPTKYTFELNYEDKE